MKHLSMDVVRVTEAAAIAASAWVGTGEKELADKAATDAMRKRLNELPFGAIVIHGEGEKDESYGIFPGEGVGAFYSSDSLRGKLYEICVDPIEGTRPTVTSGPEAISVIGISEPNSMFATKDFYALKLAFGKKIVESGLNLSLNTPLSKIVLDASIALKKPISSVVVCILDRPRHKEIIANLRRIGCRIKLIQDCDVSGALACCLRDGGVDILYGVGGAPEAVITACAMKCLGGEIQVKFLDENMNPRGENYLSTHDLVKGDCVFAATGITNGSFLKGVRFDEHGPITNSVFMRSASRTIRWLTTEHGN